MKFYSILAKSFSFWLINTNKIDIRTLKSNKNDKYSNITLKFKFQ